MRYPMHAGESTHPRLTVYLFGELEFSRGDEALPPLATRKTQSLLAYLILYRHQAHARDELAALLWGDRDDSHARRSLATALWRIRRLLGEDSLLTDATSVQFNPRIPLWLDVAEFEKIADFRFLISDSPAQLAIENLQSAIELYRGDLLEGVYDDWCIEERYRLEALYLDALNRLVVWHAAQGDARAVLAYARKYLAHDPLAEHIHLAAMRSLVALGDVAGARRQWQLCCEMRQQELHVPLSAEILQQAESILGSSFILPLPVAPAPSAPLRRGSLERPPFVGRAREMEALRALWEQATQGRGGTVLIGGEAGVGKTRLTEEFAAVVRRRGGMVTHGRCYEPERMLPYQPLAEMLRDLIVQTEGVASALPVWARSELARLIPEIGPPPIQPKSSPRPLQPEHQALLFHAVVTFIHQCASRTPLLIVLEDLHWATDSTLAAIHYLARQIADARVLCLGTFRPEEIGETHALTTLAAQLARDGLAQHLTLEPLPAEATSELVRRTFKADADAEFVKRLYTHTEGNVFFLIETLRALQVSAPAPSHAAGASEGLPVPDNVRALIGARVGRLSTRAREILACAAVAGRTFDLDLVRHAEGIDEETALEAIDELLRQGFLREGSGLVGRDYEFMHHLTQIVTYSSIHHRRRRRLHRLLGEAMERLYADQPLVAGALAHHFESGGAAEKALHYHDLAAQRAAAVFAWQEAEEHQGRMLQLLEQLDPECVRPDCLRYRGRILADRAELRFLQARLAERDADLVALDALATTSDDDHLRLQTSLQRARYLNLDAQYAQAIATAQDGLALADMLKDTSARCYLLTQIGFGYYFLGQPQPALTALESALAMTPETDRETRRHITHILGYTHFHLGNYARALTYYRESYADHKTAGDYNGVVWAGLDIGATYREMGQLTTAERHLTEHLNLARRIGARSAEAYGLIQLGSWELSRGNYATAAELFRQALSTQQGLRTEHGRVAAETGMGYAFYQLGDLAEARRWLEQAVQRVRPIRHQRRLIEALIGLGLVEIAAGHPLAAHHFLSEAVVVARDSEARGNLAAGLAALAHAERRLGNPAQALAHASEAVSIAHDLVAPVYEMWGELEMGLAWLAQGNPQIALEHTQHAVDLIPRSDESWIGTEQVHKAHAQVLRALGRMPQAEAQEQIAVRIVEAKANRIPDPGLRQTYLHAVKREP